MTTDIRAGALQQTTDAEFRAWGSRLSATFAAVGMVKGTDSGQIDWNTVVKPPSSNAQQGYEIWRFNDSLQATKPIYLRIGFGGGTNQTYPSIWLTIGKGSDGIGNITGVFLAATQHTWVTASATVSNWFTSSMDGSALICVPGLMSQVGAGSWWWLIERSRDASGAPTGTGLVFIKSTGGTFTISTMAYNYAGGGVWNNGVFPVMLPCGPAQDIGIAGGGKLPVFGGVVYDGSGNFWQPRSMLVGMRQDVGSFGVFTIPDYGTYMSLGQPGSTASQYPTGIYATACLGWW